MALSASHPRGRTRAGHRPDRAERRRQDHAVQRDHRPAGPDRRAGCSSTASTSPTRARTSGPGSASPAPSRSSRCSAASPPARTSWSPPSSARRGTRREFDPGAVADEMLERVGITRRRRRHGRHLADRHGPPRRAGPGPGHQPEGAAARRAVLGAQRGRDRGGRPSSCAPSSPTAWPCCWSSTTCPS